jgi:3-oxoacyl-[acyl-carrier protein] reductase
MHLENSSVLVTGGGSGIGFKIVEQFHLRAKSLIVLEKNRESFDALLDMNPGLHIIHCDVASEKGVTDAFLEIDALGLVPNVVINNAGIIHNELLVNISKKTDRSHSFTSWKNTISANLDSVFLVTRSAVDRMLKTRKKGVVISISSISANGNPGQTAYAASKAGVNALSNTWAKELGPFGIRFVAIAPGFLETESTLNSLGYEKLKKLKQSNPLGRLGAPESIVETVKFAIENEFLNGVVLSIDGGQVI